MATNALRTPPTGPAAPDQVIVARDQAGLCQALRDLSAAGKNFIVIVERRHAERRQRVQPVLEERRRGERRNSPAIVAALRRRPYVLVHQRPRAAPD